MLGRGRLKTGIAALSAASCVTVGLAVLSLGGGAKAAGSQVYAFPVPGAHFAAPSTQITFRGIPSSQLGSQLATITVTGSESGTHTGRFQGDSDGRGGSFLPNAPFSAGETVTVHTALNVFGANAGTFSFTVADPAGPVAGPPFGPAPRVPGDVNSYHSRPDLLPAAVRILRTSPKTAPGDIFLAPQAGPVQWGPMIRDPHGNLVWFQPLPAGMQANDFRVQRLHGRPVLTWWEGMHPVWGVGTGHDVIRDSSYRQIHTVQGGNGLSPDLHEFQISRENTALVTAFYPVYTNATSVHGSSHQLVFDSVVQEIDIPTGLVLFQWDSLDHVPMTESYFTAPAANVPYDYFHVNSIDEDHDGNLIVSGRNTWAAYKVNRHTGAVIWRLGGKQSSFHMEPGTAFAWQHDVRVRAGGDEFLTVFDDGAGPPVIENQSRGLKLYLDTKHMNAWPAGGYDHSPGLLAYWEGNTQQLPNFDIFTGWGQQPYFSEFTSGGTMLFDGRFVDNNFDYRAYRFPWTGTPTQPPAVAASHTGGKMVVYASWNGATNVAYWRILGGSSASGPLHLVGAANKASFETTMHPAAAATQYVAVQAVNASHHVLGQSHTIAVK